MFHRPFPNASTWLLRNMQRKIAWVSDLSMCAQLKGASNIGKRALMSGGHTAMSLVMCEPQLKGCSLFPRYEAGENLGKSVLSLSLPRLLRSGKYRLRRFFNAVLPSQQFTPPWGMRPCYMDLKRPR